MRVTRALFTFAEMSASVHDSTFDLVGTLVNTKFVATVVDATSTLHILPLNEPSNRCPTWDELQANDDPGPGGPLSVVLTRDGNTLTANAYGGTPPYNYFFSCTPVGTCSNYTIANATQLFSSTLFDIYI